MPALTADELAQLRASIEQDGIIYPVLLDTAGQIIDGFHRKTIADELGIPCPTHTLPVSPERAAVLRVTLNMARRQLTHELWWQLVAELARPHKEQIKAEAQAAKSAGGRKGRPGERSPDRQQTFPHVTESGRDRLAAAVNKDLAAIGIKKTVAGSTIDNILATGRSGGSKTPKTKPASDPRRAATNRSLRSIRETNAVLQYESMRNAPPRKINLPFIRHAEELNRLLVEISGLDPEVAVTQIPVERCRQWQVQDAQWWLRFTKLCEKRWRKETPDVPLMRYRRNTRLGLPDDETPSVEDQLSPQQAAVYSFLIAEDRPMILLEIANATALERGSTRGALDALMKYGMVIEVKPDEGHSKMYAAAPPRTATEQDETATA